MIELLSYHAADAPPRWWAKRFLIIHQLRGRLGHHFGCRLLSIGTTMGVGFRGDLDHGVSFNASITAAGLCPITLRYARAAVSGSLRPCSQSRKVPSGI
jgi:hypothetical protein